MEQCGRSRAVGNPLSGRSVRARDHGAAADPVAAAGSAAAGASVDATSYPNTAARPDTAAGRVGPVRLVAAAGRVVPGWLVASPGGVVSARLVAAAGLIAAAGAPLAMSGPALAAQPLAGAPGIQIISPKEVLERYTREDAEGTLLFEDASGASIRLITTTDDPQIFNKGDGRFHPADPAEAAAALEGIPAGFLQPLEVRIFLLPFPRSGILSSSMDSRAIYVSPGVQSLEETLPALICHEMGHAVHHHFLPDDDEEGWKTFAGLRGIEDADRFHESAPHADRPHEIFAEDFRVLFGGAAARGNGTVENRDLLPPDQVPGLRELFLDLAGIGPEIAQSATPEIPREPWRVYPNPIGGAEPLLLRAPASWNGSGEDLPAELFDAAGRRVSRLVFVRTGDRLWSASLGGPDLRSGVYWLRAATGEARTAPILVALHVIR